MLWNYCSWVTQIELLAELLKTMSQQDLTVFSLLLYKLVDLELM